MPLANLLDRVPELVGAVRGSGGGRSGNNSSGGGGDSNGIRTISFTRMETISLEDQANNNNNNSSRRNNNDANQWPEEGARSSFGYSRRVPTLRDSAQHRSGTVVVKRYFPLLCIAQTIVIGLFIVSLYWLQGSPGGTDHTTISQPPLRSVNQYRVYTNGSTEARFLLKPASDCNQRKHDLHHGSVLCASKEAHLCSIITGTPEEPSNRSHQGAQIITTSRAGQRLHSKWVQLQEFDDCRDESECEIDSRTKLLFGNSQPKQTIIGWGGALTDSSINNILSLSANGTVRLLDDYFGQHGLRFNIIRITMGGSDFSARFYTNNDKQSPDEPDDLTMSNFRLAPEDSLYKIPMLRYIQAKYGAKLNQTGRPIKLFASMWSPPIWMKTNNHYNKGQLKGSISPTNGTNGTDERYYRALAELKKRFLLAYLENSIDFWGLTVMNEPVFAVQPFLDFNTMIFPKHDYASYVAKYLGPTIRGHEKLRHIKLMAHDDNRRFLLDFTEPTLNNPASGQYIDGVSVHGYADHDYHQMDTIYELNRHKDLFVMPTELCSGHLPWMQKALAGNWHRGVHYALDIIHSLQHSAAGWVDWNMALDMEGGPGWLGGRLDSPVLVDKVRDLYHKSPMFYVLGHFSRYIPAGSVRLESSLINGAYNYPLETVTFRTPTTYNDTERLVTVVLNANPHPIAIHLKPHDSLKLFKVECESDSITTIRYSTSLGTVQFA